MSGLFSMGSRNAQPNKLGAIQIQTSEYGVCIPVLFGSNRLAAKLIDYFGFNVQNVTTEQGGKGGGSSSSSFEYYASILMLFWKNGQYPSDGIGNIYDQGGAMELQAATENYTIPGGGGNHTVVNAGTAFYYDEGVSYQGAYSQTVNDYGSDGLKTVSGLNTMPMEKIVGTPGALEYTCSGTGTYRFAAADAGKTVSIKYAYTATPTHVARTSAPAEYLALTVFKGTRPQSAWGYLPSGHVLDYPGLVLGGVGNMDLGSNASLPSFNFEGLNGNGLAFGGGVADCDPADIITSILTDPFIGMGYPYLGDLTQLSNYCAANGIFLSPYYDSATSCSSVLEELANLANSEVFSSWDGLFKVVPYGDTTVVGFGRTFTPSTQPLYDLTIDDFITDGNGEPFTPSVPNLADNSNYMKLEFANRGNSYNTDTIDDINQASVNVIGLRPADTVQAHAITEPEVAQIVLNALLTRKSFAFRKFRFKLNQTFPHLEQMDIVTVTHPNPAYGITRWPVRIKELDEDEKTAELSITAEDFPWGAGQPAKYSRTPGGGGVAPGRLYPGNVAAPIIFEANDRISRSGGGEIWIGVVGQTGNWGGCTVWMSKDGTNYQRIGKITAQARMGELVNSVSAVADPDSTSVFQIAMAGFTPGTLTSSSTAAADGALTLSMVGNEMIAYSTVAAAIVGGAPVEELTTYTRRGVFGTAAAAHGINAPYLRLDDAVFSYPYDPSLVGVTLYFKLTSFNLLSQMEEGLADVTAYEYLVTGKFGNSNKTVMNNLTIDSVDAGASATIRVYGLDGSGVPTVGDSGYLYPRGKPAIPVPAASIYGADYLTVFIVNWNPNTNTYITYTSELAAANDQALGMIEIGSVSTCGAGGSGGGGGGGGAVVVSVSPPNASVFAGDTQQFHATVSGASNQAVTWAVNNITGGNSGVGTIDASGNYTAPGISGPRTVKATSVASPTFSKTVGVTVYA